MTFDFQPALAAYADFHRKIMQGVVEPSAAWGGSPLAGELARAWNAALAHNADEWQQRWDRHVREQYALWQKYVAAPTAPGQPEPASPPADRRFRGEGWRHPYFAYLAETYLSNARWIDELVADAPLDPPARKRFAFFARQYIDAVSPANFVWSNPEALKRALETKGESLATGLEHLREDSQRGRVSNVDRSAYAVGDNLAVTPGAVVFENRLIQLIQYEATTPKVYERPLVLVPPCINKFYILDLQPDNSFVRHAVGRGQTVFMVSWCNAGPELADLTWDDYLEEGVMAALRAARDISGADELNALGFCVGGTLLTAALAVMHARDERIVHSLTLLTTMLDYSDTGELSVLIDEAYVKHREQQLARGGLLQGGELALAFASLRANDLIWRYVVNNYLLGQKPDAFDLLYWNDDSANLPGPMYVYYLRNMYLENRLREPGKLVMCGTPVDLGKVNLPAYVVAAEQDHIVPWQTAYTSAALLGGRIDFVLTASGHIAGVVNPPPGNRRRYAAGRLQGADSAAWKAAANAEEGSWWPHWARWLARQAGKRRAARPVGSAQYPKIEPAPGRYVTENSTKS